MTCRRQVQTREPGISLDLAKKHQGLSRLLAPSLMDGECTLFFKPGNTAKEIDMSLAQAPLDQHRDGLLAAGRTKGRTTRLEWQPQRGDLCSR
jgi:hypothetical protein